MQVCEHQIIFKAAANGQAALTTASQLCNATLSRPRLDD